MTEDQFDKLLTAIMAAGWIAGNEGSRANAGKTFLIVEKSLREAGVVQTQSGDPDE